MEDQRAVLTVSGKGANRSLRPLINHRHRKLQLGFLFSLGIFVTLVTAIRVPQNFKNSTKQMDRTMWVSIEILVATFVANTPTIYGLLRQRHSRRCTHSEWSGHQIHPYPEADTSAATAGTKPEQFNPIDVSQAVTPDEEANLSRENDYHPRTRVHP
jgi:hypothetical protein